MKIKLSDFLHETYAGEDRHSKVGRLARDARNIFGYIPYMANVLPDGKVEFIPTFEFTVQPPQPRITSLTRFLRWCEQRIPSFKDVDWQPLQDAIVNYAASAMDTGRWTYQLVEGEDIVEAYKTGPNSCMKGKRLQLSLYVANVGKVGLLKIHDKGVYTGRALVWFLDDGRTLLDRIYPGNGILSVATRHYAKSQGWLHTEVDSVAAEIAGDPEVHVTLKHVRNRRIAYLDTMRYIVDAQHDKFILSNHGRCEVDGHKRILRRGIGDYESADSTMYSSYLKYLDGMPYVNSYKRVSNYMAFVQDNEHMIDVVIGKHTRRYALRPTDVVLKHHIEDVVLRSQDMRLIDGKYYHRSFTRKVRNQDAYTVLPDGPAFIVKQTTTMPNGATIINLEGPL